MKLQTKLPLLVATCTIALLGGYYLLSSYSANKAIIKFDSSALITLSRSYSEELRVYKFINSLEPLDSNQALINLLEQTYPHHYFILLINGQITQHTMLDAGFELDLLISSPQLQFTVKDENKTIVMQAFSEPAKVTINGHSADVLWFAKHVLDQHSQDIDMRELLHKDFAFWLVVLSLIAVSLSWLNAWYFLRPMRSLSRAFTAIEEGNFNTQISQSGNDEISDLITSFNRMAEKLARTTQQRDQLTADLAHELRAPLTSLRARIEAIQDGILPAEPDQFKTLIGQTISLDNLIEDLHAISNGTTTLSPLDIRPQKPAEIVKSLCDAYQPLVEKSDMKLFFNSADDRAALIDSQRLNQILLNLIENAIKYSHQGAVISVEVVPKDTFICVLVKDKGPGIEQENLQHIFNRHYREPMQLNTHGKGLGLDICARLIKQMNADMTVKSKFHQGTCFTLKFSAIKDTNV